MRRVIIRRDAIESGLLLLPAILLLIGLFIYPFIYGLNLSLHDNVNGTGPLTLANYQNFLSDPNQLQTIWMTIQVSIPATIASVLVSIPLAYFMRRGIRFERLITTILILPITLGSVMVAQAMLIYFGRQGWFNQALEAIGLVSVKQPLTLVHNVLAVQIALFIQGFPFVFLLIFGYMSGINPDLERASRMLGASAWQTFRRVILPLTLPGIAIAFCLSFVANFTVFPSAQIVGEPNRLTRVLAITAYRAAYEGNYNPPPGIAIALIMGAIELLVVAVVLGLRYRFVRGGTLGGGKGA
ncbi:MAG: ABC transporter permease [Aggregatilineales bacterium]